MADEEDNYDDDFEEYEGDEEPSPQGKGAAGAKYDDDFEAEVDPEQAAKLEEEKKKKAEEEKLKKELEALRKEDEDELERFLNDDGDSFDDEQMDKIVEKKKRMSVVAPSGMNVFRPDKPNKQTLKDKKKEAELAQTPELPPPEPEPEPPAKKPADFEDIISEAEEVVEGIIEILLAKVAKKADLEAMLDKMEAAEKVKEEEERAKVEEQEDEDKKWATQFLAGEDWQGSLRNELRNGSTQGEEVVLDKRGRDALHDMEVPFNLTARGKVDLDKYVPPPDVDMSKKMETKIQVVQKSSGFQGGAGMARYAQI
mmetsp:Transcript_35860/g.43301  ORF Transcript_35860/g.43301 Transcript_35860/m.43301 type:complete len:312 (-) Transcript_35860:31-966(-)|eukprot:CAMPEP_0197862356 /NCGR_PEP_ID=MMETSP1438-20131217/39054_1 /TAXON_ID=1461541 /ORGANISM="Pterosperma sp., Strain CCMP1384" /LENGTH=311 /DNA_ID=CAMNT_0043479895 /DNA_START=401 /DNA_END=1336 /DNA_ORIENTATION=+